MRRIRMESMDIEDIDPFRMSVLSLEIAPTVPNTGNTDWACGRCDETLIHRASDCANDGIVFRCPYCFRFSRFRQVQ